jgi:hypothetical protein
MHTLGSMCEGKLTPLQLSKAQKAIEVFSSITDGVGESTSSDSKTQDGEK